MLNDDGFNKRLILCRAKKGLSQADLSKLSGVAASQISRYELGNSKPRVHIIQKLANALNISFSYLATGETDHDDEQKQQNSPVNYGAWDIDKCLKHLELLEKYQAERDKKENKSEKEREQFALEISDSILILTSLKMLIPMYDKLCIIGRTLEKEGKIKTHWGDHYALVAVNYIMKEFGY